MVTLDQSKWYQSIPDYQNDLDGIDHIICMEWPSDSKHKSHKYQQGWKLKLEKTP